ncbi:hypothetical protein N0V88_000745 [Collariella sp. IMI 366227]|nr:hypothetical protein N0V88_000745 [Collariella sp. IMI 366227]
MAEPPARGLAFHVFPRLPLELRQRIWELSIEPRDVIIVASHYKGPDLHSTPPPPLLLACAESRAYIKKFYTRAFIKDWRNPSEARKHLWINFDIDDLKMMDTDFLYFSAIPLIQRLKVVTYDLEWFVRKYVEPNIWEAEALETLTIIDEEGEEEFGWAIGWESFMQNLYHRCDPVPFYTTIIHQDLVLTTDNWLKRLRQLRRKNWGPDMEEHPERYTSDDALSEADDDPRDSKSLPWKHTKECDCPPEKGHDGMRRKNAHVS